MRGLNEDQDDRDQTAAGDVTNAMLNPETLALLQDSLAMDTRTQALDNYQRQPACVKRRVKALKKLQLEMHNVESDFYREVHELAMKYAAKYEPFYEKRVEVTSGRLEPTDEECEWTFDDEEDDDETEEAQQNGEENAENPSGIPEFWLTVLQNAAPVNEIIREHDIPILRHLTDVRIVYNSEDQRPGFSIDFYFSQNEFFTNEKLRKTYFFNFDPPALAPLEYEGPEIVQCEGTNIDWHPGKNATLKKVRKVQQKKSTKERRTLTEMVQNDSFFLFFSPPLQSLEDLADDNEEDEAIAIRLGSDFLAAQALRENIIPRAVMFFTGEELEDEDEFDEEEELEESEEEVEENNRRGQARVADLLGWLMSN